MTEIEFIIFSLEIFCLRFKSKTDLRELKYFRSQVFMLARSSDNLDDFKFKLRCFDSHKIFKIYLRYINLLDKYYAYINGKDVYVNLSEW